jgi:hypothetical protein
MPLFDRKARTHRVVVLQLGKELEGVPFWALCDCGWNTLPRATREEAFADAYGHDKNVVEEVELVLEEGGVGWLCFFCGAVVDEAPVRLRASWTEGAEEQEQWFAAHRECVIRHASDDESIRDGPLFDT